MRQITLTVNDRTVTETVHPRTHLADFLRDRLNMTGTHLRCEQGACGACTLLIDGQPARSCITYAIMCDGAKVRTIEGLQEDAVIVALRRAFSEEHGLQCGFCTPGMLVTARDIVLRLPDATGDRVRLELSGNLCRCTGYVGIVRAIKRVLDENRAGKISSPARELGPVGPVGAHADRNGGEAHVRTVSPSATAENVSQASGTLGLSGRKPNLEIHNRLTVARPADEVWTFFADPTEVVGCLPGARIVAVRGANEFDGVMSVKLGPITANFSGTAQISRDEARRSGLIVGSGNDRNGGSRAAGEVAYSVRSARADTTTVELTVRALLAGPLAQFSRSGIVEELVSKLTERFSANLERRLAGSLSAKNGNEPLKAGYLFWSALVARLKSFFSHPSSGAPSH